MDLGLKGLKAIVTGGTRGIGRAIAGGLAAEGCAIALCARAQQGVTKAVSELKAAGVPAFGKALNVRDGEAYKAWLAEASAALGGCDLFVANVSAGGGMDSERNWHRNFEIDLMSVVRGIEALEPQLKQSKAASVLIVATMAASETFAGPMAYNALKAALLTYAKQLSQKFMRRNIRVNCLSPGPTVYPGSAWEMVAIADKKFHAATIRQQPARRMAAPEEIAQPALFLLSPAASWVTGAHLLADGGFSKRVQF